MQRMGWVIGIKPEKIAEYKALHAAVWPAVLARIAQAQVRNYTIFLREPENLLFGYWEYTGSDYPADMKTLGPAIRRGEWNDYVIRAQGRRIIGDADHRSVSGHQDAVGG